ncbi:MAG: RagB/SusD family nutrient uptake outer membrane protein [Cytophagales bacterium]|nr:RagB/SusD family nutrient uptake outer membrane protein [Cytophagales bacterium]
MLLGFLLGVGCTQWIEEPVIPYVQPSTVDEYERVLNGSYPGVYHTLLTSLLADVLTLDDTGGQQLSPLVRNAYLWGDADDPQQVGASISFSYPWLQYYGIIYKANYVISEVDTSENVLERSRALSLIAEAHLIRAHCYLYLGMLYAETYDPSTALVHLGVPLVTEPLDASTDTYKRDKLVDLYDQIEKDILLGIRFLRDEHVSHKKFRFTRASAYALASRYYLYKSHNYVNAVDEPIIRASEILSPSDDDPVYFLKKVVEYATEGLALNSSAKDMKRLDTRGISDPRQFARDYFDASNPEVLLSSLSLNFYTIFRQGFNLNGLRAEMAEKFPGDARTELFQQSGALSQAYLSIKTDNGYSGFAVPLYKVEELYYNRAEAMTRLGLLYSAFEDLNHVSSLKRRTPEGTLFSVLDYQGQDEILDLIFDLRKLEFYMEGHRWIDLKRFHRPRIAHTFRGEVFVLDSLDVRYILPIPKREVSLGAIQTNPSNNLVDDIGAEL